MFIMIHSWKIVVKEVKVAAGAATTVAMGSGMAVLEEALEQAVEMMDALLAGGGVAAAVVEARADASLDALDDGFVFPLDTVQPRARAAVEAGGVPDVGEEGDL